jgi:hypothetical protein
MAWQNLHEDLLNEFAECSVFTTTQYAIDLLQVGGSHFYKYGEEERTAARESMRALRKKRSEEGYHRTRASGSDNWVPGPRPVHVSLVAQERARGEELRRDKEERWKRAAELLASGVPAKRVVILCKMSIRSAIDLRNSLGIGPSRGYGLKSSESLKSLKSSEQLKSSEEESRV